MMQKKLGALSPNQALTYMKETKDLLIVDVAAEKWFDKKHFLEAVNIPIESLTKNEEINLYEQLPEKRPVILHCRSGMIVPAAYATLAKVRADIPEVAYIDGAPLFEEYNSWKLGKTK